MNTFRISTGNAKAVPVMVTFADGEHQLEEWMVAHLGGTEKVDNTVFRQQAAEFTFQDFVAAFFNQAAEEQLSAIGQQIIHQHLFKGTH